jgi:DNA gyrase/topoisomerase IV subunit B
MNENNLNEDFNKEEIEISVLEGPAIVRERAGMYVGSLENPDVIFREIVDNAFDEVYASKRSVGDKIFIDTSYNGMYCIVADAGRGLPISYAKNTKGASNSHEFDNITQAELSCTRLHAGSKFDASKGVSVGTNGVGSVATCALSESYIILSRITEKNYNQSIPDVFNVWNSAGPRSKKDLYYILVLEKGVKVYEGAGKLKDISNHIFGNIPGYVDIPSGYSTIVLFRPDPTIFETTKITVPYKNLENFLLIQDKIFKKKVEIVCDGQLLSSASFVPYQFEMVKRIIPADTSRNKEVIAYITFEVDPGLGSKTFEGSLNALVTNRGVHIQYVESCFEQALKSEFKINHRYITNGLQAKVIFLAENFMFDSQTKTTLKSIDKTKLADYAPIAKEFVKIFKANPEYWEAHVDRLNYLAQSMHSLGAVDRAKGLISSGNNFYKMKSKFTEGFSDACAPRNDRWQAEIFVCEGLSPAGSLKRGRHGTYSHAVLPLRGRCISGDGLSVEKLLDNQEMNTLFSCIGLGLDCHFIGSDCSTPEEAYQMIQKHSNYGKIILAMDEDQDGKAIVNTLVYNIFKFARFIIDFGMLYIVESPFFSQGGKNFYASDPVDQDGIPIGIDKSKPFRRYKGLGSINDTEVYNSFFNPNTRRLYRVTVEGSDFATSLVEDINCRKALLRESGILTNPFNLTGE